MQRFQGKGVLAGIAIGRIKVYKREKQQVIRRRVEDAEHELARFRQAKDEAEKQLEELYRRALQEFGREDAAIFEMHRLLLEDRDYSDIIERMICEQQINAEYAVKLAEDKFLEIFTEMNDEYIRARAADIRDISECLRKVLRGEVETKQQWPEPVIIVAEDLTPSETVQLDKSRVLALVTRGGSVSSHTAILARTMGIPALVGVDMSIESAWEGCKGLVDSTEGVFYVEPDVETLELFQGRQQAYKEKAELLQGLKDKETITSDGQKLWLGANIGNLQDLEQVLQNGADGIGLFRSEFLYLGRDCLPTEEEQFQIYRTVAETMAGKPVVIRTLDIGADKQCDYFDLDKEDNPALGYRAVRICLSRPEIFKTQLRALFRAGAYGNLSIMYPMIISVEEVRRIRQLTEEVRAELAAEGTAFGELRQGIMIETPAAVMISDMLAKEVDFFSIGTNDLTQYTLAIDRQNPKLEAFYNPHHPAVLRMIAMVVESAHKAGISVGICGELGADMELTKEFLALGVDELSVSPGSVLPLRKLIRETSVAEYRKES